MGGGSYSSVTRDLRSQAFGYETKSRQELFPSTKMPPDMDPMGVELREARDSIEHPESIPIIIALDVTGSMGGIPHQLLKDGLPTIMDKIFEAGIQHPQIMFMAVGDHEYDSAPLQISQFESSDEKLDHWLTTVWLEGYGGGNEGESYLLPWMFTSKIKTDHWEKRGKKGILITIGDERCLTSISASESAKVFGKPCPTSMVEALELAKKEWKVFHLNVINTHAGGQPINVNFWKELDLTVKFIDKKDVAATIAQIVAENADVSKAVGGVQASPVANDVDQFPSDIPEHDGGIREDAAEALPDDTPIPDEVKEGKKSDLDDLPDAL